jgi:predicted glutamine amidotransferase
MCLIVAKPRGQPMPGKKRLKRWFDSYHDGMGLAFQNNGEVRVIKGAMNHAEMFEVINIMKQYLKKEDKTPVDVDVVVQYRQAFTGSVCPEYCHPFPVLSGSTTTGLTIGGATIIQ